MSFVPSWLSFGRAEKHFLRLAATIGIALAVCWAVGPIGLGASPGAKGKAAKDDWEPVPGYKYREINGFHLLVNNTVLEKAKKSEDRRKPMEVLELELDLLVRAIPPRATTALRTIPVWVEWESRHANTSGAVAVYYPGNTANQVFRYESLERAVKSNCVEIVSMKYLCQEHQGEKHRCVLLHEFTHAVHHHLFGMDNPVIKAAYANAMSKGLYEGVYAATNEKEYFAEVSCAYFNYLNYRPETREELKKYDPVGYHMMELTWGTPKEIEDAQKPEREKSAMAKLAAARKLLRNKKKQDEAISALESIGEEFPGTRAAKDAAKILEKQRKVKEEKDE
jgi:hypothetical protein